MPVHSNPIPARSRLACLSFLRHSTPYLSMPCLHFKSYPRPALPIHSCLSFSVLSLPFPAPPAIPIQFSPLLSTPANQFSTLPFLACFSQPFHSTPSLTHPAFPCLAFPLQAQPILASPFLPHPARAPLYAFYAARDLRIALNPFFACLIFITEPDIRDKRS